MSNKVKILFSAFKGELKKIGIKYRFKFNCLNIGLNKSERSEIIVSLTSYGDRLARTLPYALYSLMDQELQPDKIIVWLDKNNWNDLNLNSKLKKLQERGVSFQYCEDIKSYKKLIPTLKKYPSSVIITADDDLYYPKSFVKGLITAHEQHPEYVHAYMVHQIVFKKDGEIAPYNDWLHYIKANERGVNFSTSGGGCVYSSSLLYKDVLKYSLFQKLSPQADDIWFFFMAYLNDTKISVVNSKSAIIPLDALYQKFHKKSSLMAINCHESFNDTQIKRIMHYYGISSSDLSKHVIVNEFQ